MVSGFGFQVSGTALPVSDASYETSGNDECRMSIDPPEAEWNRFAQSFSNRQNTLFDIRPGVLRDLRGLI
jgi:hypothetical protein